jgi:hypothetical protein
MWSLKVRVWTIPLLQVTFVCLGIFCHTQHFIGGRENPDTIYNVFGERLSTFRKPKDTLSQTLRSDRAVYERTLTGGERYRGMRPLF